MAVAVGMVEAKVMAVAVVMVEGMVMAPGKVMGVGIGVDMGTGPAMHMGIGAGHTLEEGPGSVLDGGHGGGAIRSTRAFRIYITIMRPPLLKSSLLQCISTRHLSPNKGTIGITARTPRATIHTSKSVPRGG
jgi:hypothetical protein